MRPLIAGALYFALVFAAGILLGVARTLWLAPRLGSTLAVAIELPLMLALSWAACARIVRQWRPSPLEAAAMGVAAFALLLSAEAALSVLLAGRSFADHWALYRDPANQLGLAGQIAFACFPSLQARCGRA